MPSQTVRLKDEQNGGLISTLEVVYMRPGGTSFEEN